MPEHNTGDGLDLDVGDRGALHQREAPDLCLCELDVGDRLRGQRCDRVGDLGLAQPERFG